MNILTFVETLRKDFDAEIEKKASWGKNEIQNVLSMAISSAALKAIEKIEKTSKNN